MLKIGPAVLIPLVVVLAGITPGLGQTPPSAESRHAVMTIYAASRAPRTHHQPDYGGITFYGRERSHGGGTVRANTLQAPEEALKAFKAARQAMAREGGPNLKKAAKKLDKALEIYPQFAAAWNLRGAVYAGKGQLDDARAAFHKAIEHDPSAPSGHWSLAMLEIRQQEWFRASLATTRLLELAPDDPAVRFYHGLVCYYRGYWEAAELHLSQVADGPHVDAFPLSRFFLANSHAQQGDFDLASEHFRGFLRGSDKRLVSTDLRRRIEARLSQWEDEGRLNSRP
ncbi:MAG TPA: tetratricopeptide repeat protein [Acidobacteriota bacterium]|nr:tetratricopeptide repeat protein [Acidobacteriota bacterium]